MAFLAILHNASSAAEPPIRRAADVESVGYAQAASNGIPFDITAKVIYVNGNRKNPHGSIFVKDSSGAAILQNYLPATNSSLCVGDIVRATGKIHALNNGIYAHCRSIARLSHEEPEPPLKTSIGRLHSGLLDGRLVTVKGEVSDVLPDEIDDSFLFLVLKDKGRSIYLSMHKDGDSPACQDSLIGDIVEATGVCMPGINNGLRRHIGRILQLWDARSLRTVKAAGKDIFDCPEMPDGKTSVPDGIPFLERRRISGTAIASWHDQQTMIKTDDQRLVRLVRISGDAPEAGRRIDAVGFPETDLYSVSLNSVRWRYAPGEPLPFEPPKRLTSRDLRAGHIPLRHMQARLHGMRVLVEGIVRGLPVGEKDERMILESESTLLPVDLSSCPGATKDLSIGCTVEVTGLWVAETENWRPNSVFPKIKGAFVVVNPSDRIRILSHPSWWTAKRSLTTIALLLVLLAGAVAWSRSLNRVAERCRRELRDEIVSHIASDLRLSERTSLAVELHDTIAQTLTGVALELRTAGNLLSRDPDGVRRHLDAAAKTLTSCRTELKNCLFDLRSDTLGHRDMETFIRQAVSPIIGDAGLSVRFNVPRELISDTSAHAIVRIVRELVSNAIQHGRAKKISVAGAVENGELLFSVSDNGCGFDPDRIPGAEECHFGFQGIRERVAKFRGEMSIESTPGNGARISVRLRQSQPSSPF